MTKRPVARIDQSKAPHPYHSDRILLLSLLLFIPLLLPLPLDTSRTDKIDPPANVVYMYAKYRVTSRVGGHFGSAGFNKRISMAGRHISCTEIQWTMLIRTYAYIFTSTIALSHTLITLCMQKFGTPLKTLKRRGLGPDKIATGNILTSGGVVELPCRNVQISRFFPFFRPLKRYLVKIYYNKEAIIGI